MSFPTFGRLINSLLVIYHKTLMFSSVSCQLIKNQELELTANKLSPVMNVTGLAEFARY